MRIETQYYLGQEKEEKVQEHCGVVAIYNPTDNTPQLLHNLLIAGEGVQHRGLHGAGIATYSKERKINSYTGTGFIQHIFKEDVLQRFYTPDATYAMLQTRYGTSGDDSENNLQPCRVTAPDGTQIALIHNGEFPAKKKMLQELRNKHNIDLPEDVSDTYAFTQLLALEQGDGYEKKLVSILKRIKGAYCLAIGINDSLYIARDETGNRPFVLGKYEDGWIGASETFALDQLGITPEREVLRGEISKLDKNGLTIIQEGHLGAGCYDTLEAAYFSNSKSKFPIYQSSDDGLYPKRWKPFYEFREEVGRRLAEEKPVKYADYVIGIPESGLDYARGFAEVSGIPLLENVIHKKNKIRAFQMVDKVHRETNGNEIYSANASSSAYGKVVDDKLKYHEELAHQVLSGTVIVGIDDSVVRGPTSIGIIERLKEFGVKEVHWRSGHPQILYTDHLGTSIRTRHELVSFRCSSDEIKIAEEIGADSVGFISEEAFIHARNPNSPIEIPENRQELFLRNGFNGGIINGEYPVSKDGKLHRVVYDMSAGRREHANAGRKSSREVSLVGSY